MTDRVRDDQHRQSLRGGNATGDLIRRRHVVNLARPFTRVHELIARTFTADRPVRRVIQAGALPWRIDSTGAVELLLVTSRNTARWIVPKGWPMIGKSLAEAAAQEAFEEAGIQGEISASEIGSFDHLKTHPVMGRLSCQIFVFPLEVREELDDWPEKDERVRKWLSREEAAATVDSLALRTIIETFNAR